MNPSQIKKVIDKLPYVPSRMPRTYHHDYLRRKCLFFSNKSRGEVAKYKSDDTELYALALCQLIDEVGVRVLLHKLTLEDKEVILDCFEMADEIIAKHNNMAANTLTI